METIKIPGRLESVAIDNIVANTSAIYDTNANATLSVINYLVNTNLQNLNLVVDSISGMQVVNETRSSLNALENVAYIWETPVTTLNISLIAPARTNKMAVYSFYVKTGNTTPTITITSASANVIEPSDLVYETNTWVEIQVVYVHGQFFLRAINY